MTRALLALGALAGAPVWARPAEHWLDRAHDAVVDRLDRTANWFDGFFGDARSLAESGAGGAGRASAHLNLLLEHFQSGVDDESEPDLRIRGGADLPRLENRLRLILTSDADATLTGRDLLWTAPERSPRPEDAGGVGLRLMVRDTPRHRFGLGGGLAGGLSPGAAVNARYRYTRPLGASARARLTPTLYWRSERGPGLSAVAEIEWFPDARALWRGALFGDYREPDGELEWSGQLGWLRRLDARSALNPRLGARGDLQPRNELRELWTSVRYRRRVARPWLFVEIEPGLSWHERMEFQVEPTLALRLEIQFAKGE